MDPLRKIATHRDRAAALLIVLAFVVLMTGVGVAYLSRTTGDRQVAHGSFNQSKADQLVASAMDNIIGDLRQEIVNGSASPAPTFGPNSSPGPFSLYVPCVNVGCTTPTPAPGAVCSNSTPTILPVLPIRYPSPTPGTTPTIANLIRRSVRSDPIPCPARPSRASAANSTTDVSANGRYVTPARWNTHYLIPKQNTGTNDSIPIDAFANATPDWVFVTSDPNNQDAGRRVITTPDPLVIGRYAYAIYDVGGLLDMNAAGYPSPTTILQYGRKGSLAFADLTALGLFSSSTIDNVVGWRNYASAQPSGTFPNFSFSTNSTNTYFDFILSDPNYIKLPNYLVNQSPPLTYSPIFFLTTAWQAPQNNNQTDQALATRQLLLNLRSAVSSGTSLVNFSNALQYVSTFSQEALASVPQWRPTTPDSINPNFQTLLVTAPFTRNDGTLAYVGDYLVNQRFLLKRLNWLTYKGPSATVANGGTRNAVPTSAPAIGNSDYDLWLLTRPNGITFGLTSAFLQQGTAANILNYFGLAWDATNERWNYVGHSGSSTPINNIATFGVGGTQAATREPDFFELLQAGIINNSLGDAFSPDPTALPIAHQQSKMLHILSIGANLIAQSRVDSYPVRIACTVNVGGTPRIMEAVGVPRLPYISGLAACPVGGTGPTGGVNWLLVPNFWDPFRDTWDLTEANAGNNGNGPSLTPGYLRPSVRITVSGNLGFGTAAASQSGSVAPGSLTTFATPLAVNPALSATFANNNSTFGRDGLLEASRLGISDLGGTAPASYTTTTSPASAGYAWNQVVRPPRPDGTLPGTTNFVVFRVSLPGSGITTTGQKPVLILKPGFQITLDYQSPNGTWYPYSFLQGNRVTDSAGNPVTDTWISSNLNLATTFSQYQQPTGFTAPTVVNSGTSNPTRWDQTTGGVTALAQAPMFAKADPRSIRYNSQIGAVSLASPPMSVVSAGIVGSIWPHGYSTPPPMIPGPSPAPTPPPNANPATYSQSGDNGPAGTNPYDESGGDVVRPIVMNRPFRSVGEMSYVFRDQPFRTLSFSSSNSPDAGLLDLFTTVAYGPTPTPSPSPTVTPIPSATPRGGVISLNSLQAPALAAVIASTIMHEDTPRQMSGGAPSPSPSPVVTATQANNVAASLALSTSSSPVLNRAGLSDLTAGLSAATGLGPSAPKTQREAVARALGEVVQTRTWNLLIDVIAQSGRYPPTATSLQNGFLVEGEQHYWVHVAIDRFTGQVIAKQIEVVNE